MYKYLIFLTLFASPSFANTKLFPAKKENCVITSTLEYFTDEIKTETNSFYFKNKKDCEEVKKTFSNNFSPKEIKKFNVKMDWSEK